MIDKLIELDYNVLHSKYKNSNSDFFKDLFLDSLTKNFKKVDIRTLMKYYDDEDDRRIQIRLRDCINKVFKKMNKKELKK